MQFLTSESADRGQPITASSLCASIAAGGQEGVLVVTTRDRSCEQLVATLGRELDNPTHHRDGEPAKGHYTNERVLHFWAEAFGEAVRGSTEDIVLLLEELGEILERAQFGSLGLIEAGSLTVLICRTLEPLVQSRLGV